MIDRLSFIVRQGEAVALIGPNGSGKTTLMRLLLALVRSRSGSVRLLGEDLGSLDGARLRRLRAPEAAFGIAAQEYKWRVLWTLLPVAVPFYSAFMSPSP